MSRDNTTTAILAFCELCNRARITLVWHREGEMRSDYDEIAECRGNDGHDNAWIVAEGKRVELYERLWSVDR